MDPYVRNKALTCLHGGLKPYLSGAVPNRLSVFAERHRLFDGDSCFPGSNDPANVPNQAYLVPAGHERWKHLLLQRTHVSSCNETDNTPAGA